MRLFMIFITGGAILAMELISSRIMKPYFGVTLYIWAGILATTLVFLALGYGFGGRLTHKMKRETVDSLFHAAPAVAGLAILASSLIYPHVFRGLADWDLIKGSFVACSILMAVPLTIMAALNPLLVTLVDLPAKVSVTDSGAGHVYFISTVGSVAGVLFSAFAILPFVSNQQAMLVIALLLGLISTGGAVAHPGLPLTMRRFAGGLGAAVMLGAMGIWASAA